MRWESDNFLERDAYHYAHRAPLHKRLSCKALTGTRSSA